MIDLDALERLAQEHRNGGDEHEAKMIEGLLAEVRAAREWLRAHDWNIGHERHIHQVDRLRAVEHKDNAAREAYRKVVEANS